MKIPTASGVHTWGNRAPAMAHSHAESRQECPGIQSEPRPVRCHHRAAESHDAGSRGQDERAGAGLAEGAGQAPGRDGQQGECRRGCREGGAALHSGPYAWVGPPPLSSRPRPSTPHIHTCCLRLTWCHFLAGPPGAGSTEEDAGRSVEVTTAAAQRAFSTLPGRRGSRHAEVRPGKQQGGRQALLGRQVAGWVPRQAAPS